jgi:secreted trypsin-like serine protease
VSGEIIFEGDNGRQTIDVDDFIVHPDWNGDVLRGDDIALLKLAEEPDPDITSYDISTAANPLNQTVEKVGYGRTGTGATGDTSASGTKHNGLNLYDAFGDSMWANFGRTPSIDFIAGSQLQYDFDNGLPGNDAFGVLLGLDELGFGLDEVMSAPGDSGGPSFLNDEIAGVTSYGLRINNGSDIDGIVNSTYGEFGGDANVAFYHDWIQDNAEAEEVPVPATLLLLGVGLANLAVLIARQSRRRDPNGDNPV